MLAEWNAECAGDDPVLVVPWAAKADDLSAPRFIDLRENPYDLDHLPEAEANPPLMQALRALNAPRSPVFTAKCDAWPLDPEELAALSCHLDVSPTDHPAGFASYIDILHRDRGLFVSFHQQEQFLDRFTRRAAVLDPPEAMLDCVLRPAVLDLEGVREGYSISLYVKALGPDAETAWQRWGAALDAVVALLRSKEMTAP